MQIWHKKISKLSKFSCSAWVSKKLKCVSKCRIGDGFKGWGGKGEWVCRDGTGWVSKGQ